MQFSTAGATFLRTLEGFEANWYLDPVGVPTIGVGFTWRSSAFRKWWAARRPGQEFKRGVTMTRAEADEALAMLVDEEYGKAVNEHLRGAAVPQHVFDGAVSPVYNLGPGSLKWNWATALAAGDIHNAAALLKGTGTTAGGKKLNGLVARRLDESELIEFGDYGVRQRPVKDAKAEHPKETWVEDADGVLVRRERGPRVTELQKALAAKGFYAGVVDDKFGHGTEAAVLAFQRSVGLDADGKAGPMTMAALVTGAPSPTPLPAAAAKDEVPSQTETQQAYGWAFSGWFIATLLALVVISFVAYLYFKGTVHG